VSRGHKGQSESSMSIERRPRTTEPRTAEERRIRENELKRRGRWLNPETKAMIAEGRRERAQQAREARQRRQTAEGRHADVPDDYYRDAYRRMSDEGRIRE
jgi:hypothetical protein